MLSELVGSKGVVFVLDNLSTNKLAQAIDFPNLPNVLFSKGDISNNIDLKRFLGKKPDCVFHLAAFLLIKTQLIIELSTKTDIIGLIKTLDMSVLSNIKKFIYASSGCSIYGSYGKMPLKRISLCTLQHLIKLIKCQVKCIQFYQSSLQSKNCKLQIL